MGRETAQVVVNGDVTRLPLDRSDKLNAFTLAMHAELRAAREAAAVLTGAGRAFRAGQQLAETRPGTEGGVPDASGAWMFPRGDGPARAGG